MNDRQTHWRDAAVGLARGWPSPPISQSDFTGRDAAGRDSGPAARSTRFSSLHDALASLGGPAFQPARPQAPQPPSPFAIFGVFLLILASKLLLIALAASPIPFADEWDGEAAGVIRPFLEGQFDLRSLLRHDNEHLIFFTRLMTLLSLKISGYWDVILPMIVNAVLHSATLALLLASLTRVLDRGKSLAALIVGCGLAALPFGYENTLLGFNTHFYTLMACSFAALWLAAGAKAWSPRWLLAVLATIGAFLSMASGALAPAIVAGLTLIQAVRGRRSGVREWSGLVALLAMSLFFVALTPSVDANDVYRAHSLPAFADGLLDLLAWPIRSRIGALIFLPGIAFACILWRDRPRLDDPRWFVLGVLGWVLVQMAALAYGRNQILASRYFDFCVVGLYVNLVAALWLAPKWRALDQPHALVAVGAAVLALAIGVLTINHGRAVPLDAVRMRRDDALIQQVKLRAYVTTADAAQLDGRILRDLPYPDRERLKALLDDPAIRTVLPPAIDPDQRIKPTVEAVKALALASWPLFVAAGLLCWIVAIRRVGGGAGRTSEGTGLRRQAAR
jgi:hypothetical protein